MKNVKSYYVESAIEDERKVISINNGIAIIDESKQDYTWLDHYKILADQSAKVDRTLIDGKWYTYLKSEVKDNEANGGAKAAQAVAEVINKDNTTQTNLF